MIFSSKNRLSGYLSDQKRVGSTSRFLLLNYDFRGTPHSFSQALTTPPLKLKYPIGHEFH